MSQDFINSKVNEMPERLQAVIDEDEAMTNYQYDQFGINQMMLCSRVMLIKKGR